MTRRTAAARPAPWRAVLVGLAGTVTLTSVLAACAQDDTPRNASDEPTVETSTPVETTDTPTPTDTATPTPTASTPAPTVTETVTETPAADLTSLLLPARAMGGLNETWRWRDGETRTDEPPAGQLADCVRFSFKAIGAGEVATRTFLPPAGAGDVESSAFQLVAEMPDNDTAARVMEVLKSWRNTCQRRLNDASDQPHRVSSAAAVRAGDDAFEYLHSTPGSTPDTTLFEDVAQVRVGTRVSLVVVRLDAQDYNYESAKTPAARSVVAAARRLG